MENSAVMDISVASCGILPTVHERKKIERIEFQHGILRIKNSYAKIEGRGRTKDGSADILRHARTNAIRPDSDRQSLREGFMKDHSHSPLTGMPSGLCAKRHSPLLCSPTGERMDATRCLLRLFGDETECNVQSISTADGADAVIVELTPPLKLPPPAAASASSSSSLSSAAAEMVARLASTAGRRRVFDGAFGPADSQDRVCNSILQDLVPRYPFLEEFL